MSERDFLPVILGSDENAYGTVRLFREAYGIRPLLLCTRRLIPTLDSDLFDIECIPDFDSEKVFPDALRRILTEKKKEYGKLIVVACSDYYAAMMSKYGAGFGDLVANSFISPSLLDTLDTKDKFYALCEKYGLDYPKTVVASPENRESAVEDMGFSFPIVVKPENSNAYEYLHCSFEGKKKVFFFDTKEEYLTVIRAMNGSDYRGNLIIQEFIPGGDDAMRVMNAYSGNDGKVRVMCLGQPVLEEYSPKTLGNYAAIISRSDKEICDRIRGFLEEIGYVGYSNFDMKYDRRTGKYMMFEINPRPGRSSYFVRAAGINMMKELVDDAVYGKKRDAVLYSSETALWTAVPKGVLLKYVKDEGLRSEIRTLWKAKKVARTLFNPEDKNLKRRLRVRRYYLTYYKAYRLYYFDKEARSAKQ